MPAWPAQQRDDEAWAMVAFLLTLPILTGEDYKRLVRGAKPIPAGKAAIHELVGPAQTPVAATENCGRCHGLDGNGRGVGAFPKLAGQKPDYLIASMEAYAGGRRFSGIMEPIAVALSRQATVQLARYYAALPKKPVSDGPPGAQQGIDIPYEETPRNSFQATQIHDQGSSGLRPREAPARQPESSTAPIVAFISFGSAPQSRHDNAQSPSAIARGKQIAMRGIPQQKVPACSECHGPGETRRNKHYPMLAGQYADYLVLQLKLFKSRARGGTAYAHLMRSVGAGLTPAQMRDVALFYESLQP
jgi:cytochrome c553